MELFQVQGFFAPILAVMSGLALLVLWHFHPNIRYLKHFGIALFTFAGGFLFSQVVFEKMSLIGSFSSTLLYFSTSGLMIHGAKSRLGSSLNLKLHILLASLDFLGRAAIILSGFSITTYLIYANAMMGLPLGLAAIGLMRHKRRDPQSVFLAIAYSCIALMAIFAPGIVLNIGENINSETYFSSYYWVALSFLTVIGVGLMIMSFAFAVSSDIVRSTGEQASRDALSGLRARKSFDEAVADLIKNQQIDDEPLFFVLCDIDHFKRVNDVFGHDVGDNVIAELGNIIQDAIPDGAIAGRLGGEEFGIVYQGGSIAGAKLFAEGIRTVFSKTSIKGVASDKALTASFGITQFVVGDDYSFAFKRADQALYEAKRSGRDQVVVKAIASAGQLGQAAA